MSAVNKPLTLIPFGPFEFDRTSQELRKQGHRLHLPRQSFQILKMLLERPGELITREQLRATLWPSDTSLLTTGKWLGSGQTAAAQRIDATALFCFVRWDRGVRRCTS